MPPDPRPRRRRGQTAATLQGRWRRGVGVVGALAQFRREGDCPTSRKALARAVRTNGHVSAYLLGRKKLPRSLPALISMGGEDEAIAYVHDAAPAWAATPSAVAWVGAVLS